MIQYDISRTFWKYSGYLEDFGEAVLFALWLFQGVEPPGKRWKDDDHFPTVFPWLFHR